MRTAYLVLVAIAGIGFFIKDIKGFVLGKTSIVEDKPIAMVRVADTVYHCSKVSKGVCGMSATCGRWNLYCIKGDYEVQYLMDL